MKKLMFGAALAATSMAFALPEAQVYDVSLTIKTTKAVAPKNLKSCFICELGDIEAYRSQTSLTWKGLLWDCDCPAINGEWRFVTDCDGEIVETSIAGGVLWDSKSGNVVYLGNGADLSDIETVPGTSWNWGILNLIEKDAKSVEGFWDINSYNEICGENVELFHFYGAGFGKVVFGKNLSKDYAAVPCNSYIKTISGNFAGYRYAPSVTDQGSYGCAFCGKGAWDACVFAPAVPWCNNDIAETDCECDTCDMQFFLGEEYTAAYGQWTIKYNAKASKNLYKNGGSILNAGVKLPEDVKLAIAAAEAAVRAEIEPVDPVYPTKDDCEAAEKAFNEANEKYNALVGAQDALNKANDALRDIKPLYDNATNNLALAEAARDAVIATEVAAVETAYTGVTNAQAAVDAAWAAYEADKTEGNYDAWKVATNNLGVAQTTYVAKQAAVETKKQSTEYIVKNDKVTEAQTAADKATTDFEKAKQDVADAEALVAEATPAAMEAARIDVGNAKAAWDAIKDECK